MHSSGASVDLRCTLGPGRTRHQYATLIWMVHGLKCSMIVRKVSCLILCSRGLVVRSGASGLTKGLRSIGYNYQPMQGFFLMQAIGTIPSIAVKEQLIRHIMRAAFHHVVMHFIMWSDLSINSCNQMCRRKSCMREAKPTQCYQFTCMHQHPHHIVGLVKGTGCRRP